MPGHRQPTPLLPDVEGRARYRLLESQITEKGFGDLQEALSWAAVLASLTSQDHDDENKEQTEGSSGTTQGQSPTTVQKVARRGKPSYQGVRGKAN